MSFWVLFQVILDLVLIAGFVGLWIRLSRPPKDDPRLSKGLQLLQTKISILEDLSDRTETQVTQLTALLEQKAKDLQNHLHEADRAIQKVDNSMNKSLEVAKIFQDKIPHQEIIERQNTIKYVKAARLAHQGFSTQEIAQQVDLTEGEISFISSVNRGQLQFSEEELPEWVKEEVGIESAPPEAIAPQPLPKVENKAQLSLSSLGEKFRSVVHTQDMIPTLAPAPAQAQPVKPEPQYAQTSKGKSVEVKKVIFPRVNVER